MHGVTICLASHAAAKMLMYVGGCDSIETISTSFNSMPSASAPEIIRHTSRERRADFHDLLMMTMPRQGKKITSLKFHHSSTCHEGVWAYGRESVCV